MWWLLQVMDTRNSYGSHHFFVKSHCFHYFITFQNYRTLNVHIYILSTILLMGLRTTTAL